MSRFVNSLPVPPTGVGEKMQFKQLLFSLLCALPVVFAIPATTVPSAYELPLVQSHKLQRGLTRKALLKHANEFFNFSQKDPDGNRAFGGVGHNLTIDYLYNSFATGEMADYYTVEKQMFVHEYSYGTSKVVVEGQTLESAYFTYSPPTDGELKLPLGLVANLGCNPVREIFMPLCDIMLTIDGAF